MAGKRLKSLSDLKYFKFFGQLHPYERFRLYLHALSFLHDCLFPGSESEWETQVKYLKFFGELSELEEEWLADMKQKTLDLSGVKVATRFSIAIILTILFGVGVYHASLGVMPSSETYLRLIVIFLYLPVFIFWHFMSKDPFGGAYEDLSARIDNLYEQLKASYYKEKKKN